MATNRYGAVNTVPLYNATGRLNRGESVAPQQFQAPNSGASRQWGSTQGMPENNPNPYMQSLNSWFSPLNLYNVQNSLNKPKRGKPDVAELEDGVQNGNGQPNVNVNISFAEQNKGANAKTFTNVNAPGAPTTGPVAGTSAAAKPARQRTPMTQAQRDARNDKRRAARAAAKTQPQGPPAPKTPATPKAPRTPKPAAATSPAATGAMNVSSDAASATQMASIGGGSSSPQSAGANWLNVGNAKGGRVS